MQFLGTRFQSTKLAAAVVFGATVLATSAIAQVSGVGNFYQVDQHVYRGAQPTTEGFQNLAKMGIKTVIDLRETDARSKQEEKVVEAAGMKYINIPLRGMSAPSEADVQKVMALFNNSEAGPVFVHCRRGADRTGTVVACYRISHDGWENAKALKEARTNGMSWVETAMQHYVMRYKAPTAIATATTGAATTVAAGQQ